MAQQPGFDFFGFGGKLGGENEVREKFWRTAKKAARQIPFMEEVVAAYYCAMDKNTPLRAKGILVAALGYFVLPADTIPDVENLSKATSPGADGDSDTDEVDFDEPTVEYVNVHGTLRPTW